VCLLKKIEFTCVQCKKVFTLRPSDIKAGRGKYCGRSCYDEFRSTNKMKLIECNCINCGSTFNIRPHRIKHGDGKYCSRECQYQGYSKRMECTCEFCGNSFTGQKNVVENGRKKYCSKPCKVNSQKKSLKLKCNNCGSDYLVRPFENTRKYCSPQCSHEGQMKKNECKCKKCGILFYEQPNRINAGKGVFCSLKCYRETSPGKILQKCKWCKQEFKVFPSQLKREGGGNFCGYTCRSSYIVSIQGGRRSSLEISIENELRKLELTYFAQYRLGKYLCDFFIPHLDLVIECDGEYWHSLPKVVKRDVRKSRWLKNNGYTIIRLPEAEIRKDPERALLSRMPSLQASLF
jgi:very-short-patch-repair endonuclease